MSLKAIWGVYHADGGIVGELRYVFGKIRGTAHCALCDITHSYVSEKKTMKECRSNSPVPFHLLLHCRNPERVFLVYHICPP